MRRKQSTRPSKKIETSKIASKKNKGGQKKRRRLKKISNVEGKNIIKNYQMLMFRK
jgi:hypothetical protein